jgi:hypothetical protein
MKKITDIEGSRKRFACLGNGRKFSDENANILVSSIMGVKGKSLENRK